MPRWAVHACLWMLCTTGVAAQVSLVDGTINGHSICGSSLDRVTDLLGRPSGVRVGSDAELKPTTLLYADVGVYVLFMHPEVNRDQPLRSAVVTLSRRYDERFEEWVDGGETFEGVNGNWKRERIAETYAGAVTAVLDQLIVLDFGTHTAGIEVEPTTGFAETAIFRCWPSDAQTQVDESVAALAVRLRAQRHQKARESAAAQQEQERLEGIRRDSVRHAKALNRVGTRTDHRYVGIVRDGERWQYWYVRCTALGVIGGRNIRREYFETPEGAEAAGFSRPADDRCFPAG